MTRDGPQEIEPPFWWAPIQASIYLQGAMTPRELHDDPEWLEYALAARAVESEVYEIEHPDGAAGAGRDSQTFYFNHDPDPDDDDGPASAQASVSP